MEYGFGDIIIRSPYTPYSIYVRGTIGVGSLGLTVGVMVCRFYEVAELAWDETWAI